MALSPEVANDRIEDGGTKVVNYSLGVSTIEALRKQAKAEDRNMSRIVEQAIREYIERKNEGKPPP